MFSVDSAKCNGCETCVTVCSQGAISLKGGGAIIDHGLCTACGLCSDLCPSGAIYEVVEQPLVAKPASQPAWVSTPGRSTLVVGRRSALAAAVAGLAPVALDVISLLTRKWFSPRQIGRNSAGFAPGCGGRRRLWRRGRRWFG